MTIRDGTGIPAIASPEHTHAGAPVAMDPPGIAVTNRDGRPVFGIAANTPDAGGRVQIATSGVVELTADQWDAVVAGETGGLQMGAVYFATGDGRLTRIHFEGAVRVGVALSATRLMVGVQSPPPQIEPWLAEIRAPGLGRRERVLIKDLAGDLAELAGIWRGYVHRASTQVHDEVDYETYQAVAIYDRERERVLLFLEGPSDGCSTCDEIYVVPIAIWTELGAPALAPIEPPIVANLIHRADNGARGESDVLRAIDERTGVGVLEIGTDDITDHYPSFVFEWNPPEVNG